MCRGFLRAFLCLLLLAFSQSDAKDLPFQLESDDWTEWKVRSLNLMGLQHTDSTVVLRELEMRPGSGYSDLALQDDIHALQNTQLFARLVVTVHADSSEEAVDVVYAVAERPRFLAYPVLSPADTQGWVYGFALMNENLGGSARFLRLIVEQGDHLDYSLEAGDPWFLGKRRPVGLRLSQRVSDALDSDCERRSRSISLSWRRYFDRQLSLGLNPFFDEMRVRNFTTETCESTVSPDGFDRIAGLGFDVNLNSTDVHLRPSKGVHGRFALRAFGLSGLENPAGVSLDASLASFHSVPIFRRAVLGLRVAAGMTGGRRGDYMKRYLGGSKRVRAGLPSDWPGWSQCVASVEYRLPLLDRQVFFKHLDVGLGLVLFADGGLSWKDEFRGDLLAAGGLGLGLRVFAPFIKVGRLDFAYKPGSGFIVTAAHGHAF
jgi:outer membrane protein assembly factor BamA